MIAMTTKSATNVNPRRFPRPRTLSAIVRVPYLVVVRREIAIDDLSPAAMKPTCGEGE
jgi:hypothetical protein